MNRNTIDTKIDTSTGMSVELSVEQSVEKSIKESIEKPFNSYRQFIESMGGVASFSKGGCSSDYDVNSFVVNLPKIL